MLKKYFELNSGFDMPSLGLGTWQVTGPELGQALAYALELGYQHIDTADAYGNHEVIGKVLLDSGIERKNLFVTTKLWRDYLTKEGVDESVGRFLMELKVDYIDLLLIHWPNRQVPVTETLAAMQEQQERGLVRSLGVSNFTFAHLREALDSGVNIAVNQVEYHPSFNQRELKEFCDKHGILITAYSPLAQGADLALPVIRELADKYERSPAQIILNWLIANNMAAIPRSADKAHILSNWQAQDFEMDAGDLERIDKEAGEQKRQLEPEWAEFDKN